MTTSLPEGFVFSQSSLQDFVDCRRRFELKYILRQHYPAPQVDEILTFEARMAQGEQFHRLVHQHLIGIPPTLLQAVPMDPEVAGWFALYLEWGLEGVPARRYPEKTLSIPIGDHHLLAKIDLLVLGDRVQIIDWKTSRQIPQAEALEDRLQTRVYRYVVARGGAYLNEGKSISPEQIEVIYWYAAHEGAIRHLAYTQAQYDADHVYFTQLLDDIQGSLSFPLTDDLRQCKFCTYRSLCDRGTVAGSLEEWDASDLDDLLTDDFEIDFDQIAEIEF
ncbi:MAG: PD-(D/E)XK nuclease family protein [Anaerolineae bacterium]